MTTRDISRNMWRVVDITMGNKDPNPVWHTERTTVEFWAEYLRNLGCRVGVQHGVAGPIERWEGPRFQLPEGFVI